MKFPIRLPRSVDNWNLDKVWWNLQHLNNFPLVHFSWWRFCKGGMKNQALIAKKFSQCMQFEIKLDGIQTLQQWRRRCSIVLKTFVLCAWIKENGNSTMKIDYNNVTLIRFRFHSYLDSSVTMRLLKSPLFNKNTARFPTIKASFVVLALPSIRVFCDIGM